MHVGVLLVGLVLLALLPPLVVVGQNGPPRPASPDPLDELGAWRDTLRFDQPPPFVLRPFIVPGSEQIYWQDARLDTTQYRLDYRRGRLWVDPLSARGRAYVVAVYRTYPFSFRDEYRRRGVTRVEEDSLGGAVMVVEEQAEGGGFDPFGGANLQRSGSITRGISAGNNRDVTVESGLRMQVSGEVADGVRVQAVLTDENTPILPEGTTQRLSEFDRVFIEVASRQGTAQLGDFDLRYDDSEFARFTRKLQGVTLFGDLPDPGTAVFGGGNVSVAGATARGIYRTQDFDAQDGVQGPYRLEGLGGERFIIVVPGSEIVYLNEQPMTRGETNDYVIDYATGEVTFTSNRLITDESRISVEFQYSTNQFTRTLLATNAGARLWQRADGSARIHFGATLLREADSRRLDAALGFTPADSALLARAGDELAFRDGAEPVEFDPEAPYVQYTREVLTDEGGEPDTIYVAVTAAPTPGIPVYRVRFTRVGDGLGRYVRVGRAVNGIQYEFRGEGLGDYEPIRLLPKPEQQRLVDLRGGVEPVRGLELFGEWAGSLNDENRFSDLDTGDDRGNAYLGGLRLRPTPVAFRDLALGTLTALVRRRFTGDNFASFDRTRPVAFARRWNLAQQGFAGSSSTVQEGDEVIDEAEFTWAVTSLTSLSAEIGRLRLQDDAFQGTRRQLIARLGESGLPRLDYRVEYITSLDTLDRVVGGRNDEDGAWLRQFARIEQPFFDRRLVPGIELEHERRRQRVVGTDTLTTHSLAFLEIRPGIVYNTERLALGGSLERRIEELPLDGALLDAARAWTVQADARYRPNEKLSTEASLGYRKRSFTEPFRVRQQRQDGESLVLKWEGGYRPFEHAVDAAWFYEALTERTPTLQEIYIRTGAELGQFVWLDGSGDTPADGVIQLDEFLPERTPDEGTYVRTFIPSDSLAAVIGVEARMRLTLEPARLWRRADTRWKRLLANVTTRSSLEIQEKSRDPNLAQIYLLNLHRFRDTTNTLNGRIRIGQEVSLFRSQARYGLDLSFNQIRALTELSAGEETRFVNLWRVEGKYRIARSWGLRLTTIWEQNRTGSDQFASRRYAIESLSLEPEVTFNASRAVTLKTNPSFAQKADAVGDRRARVLKLPFEARYSQIRRLQLTARVEHAVVTLDGAATGLAQYELTDGRGPGPSWLWSLDGQYRFNRLLRATLAYNGRALAEAPVLHTLRLQLSATF